jgi:hypothetical protein
MRLRIGFYGGTVYAHAYHISARHPDVALPMPLTLQQILPFHAETLLRVRFSLEQVPLQDQDLVWLRL